MAGRKSKWETHIQPHLNKIKEWSAEMPECDIYNKLAVSAPTWEKCKKEHPELREALLGKQKLIDDVRNALVKRALGFEYEETKKSIRKDEQGRDVVYTEITRRYSPPDVAACNSILQNMDSSWYRDRAAYELKRQELELKKIQLEQNAF